MVADATARVRTGAGFDLKVERLRLGVTQQQLADRLGVNRQRVAAIEALDCPTPKTDARYRIALLAVASR